MANSVKHLALIIVNNFRYIFITLLINGLLKRVLTVNTVKLSVKVLCLSMLFYGCYEVTREYFTYPYGYRLSVESNTDGWRLPAITICTERGVYFDKQRILREFQAFDDYQRYELGTINNTVTYMLYDRYKCITYQNMYELCEPTYHQVALNQYYAKYMPQLLANYTFAELRDKFTIRAHELVQCQAKVHIRKNLTNDKSISFDELANCSHKYPVLESVYGTNELGLCFTYLYSSYDSSRVVYLVAGDFVEFRLSYETQRRFVSHEYVETNHSKFRQIYTFENKAKQQYYINDYFVFNVFADIMHKQVSPAIHWATKVTRVGFNARLKFGSIYVEQLSRPHMSQCHKQGSLF